MDLPPLPADFVSAGSPVMNDQVTPSPTPVNQNSAATPVKPAASTIPPANLPPMFASPKKKFGGGKIIATILGIILLVGAIGAGILMTQQKQVFQQKAYTQVWGGENICDMIHVSAVEDPFCAEICGPGNDCGNAKNDLPPPGNYYSTTFTLKNISNAPHTVEFTKFAYYCPRFRYGDDNGICLQNETKMPGTVTLQPGESVSYKAEINGLLYNGKSCGTYQTDFAVHSVDGKTDCKTNQPLALAFGMCKTGRDCQSNWTPPPTATPTPTPTATPGITAQCSSVKAYTGANWVLLNEEGYSHVRAGDVLHFCVSGTSSSSPDAVSSAFDKARFKVNGVLKAETTTKRPNSQDYCQDYTVLNTDTKIDVKASIHHIVKGWVGDLTELAQPPPAQPI